MGGIPSTTSFIVENPALADLIREQDRRRKRRPAYRPPNVRRTKPDPGLVWAKHATLIGFSFAGVFSIAILLFLWRVISVSLDYSGGFFVGGGF